MDSAKHPIEPPRSRRPCRLAPSVIGGTLVVLCLSGVLPTLAAPPVKDILRETNAFRAHAGPLIGSWSTADGSASFALVAGDTGPAISGELAVFRGPEQGPNLGTLVACLLACEDIDELPKRLGSTLDKELVGLHFGDDDVLLYRLGRASEPASLELSVERDIYRPRAVVWVSESGERMLVEGLSWNQKGWALASIRVTRAGQSLDFLRQER